MDNLLQPLKAVGLNENEAQTYLCLLRLGPQSVSVIAKKTGLNRSSCYVILERLLQKGFIEKLIQANNSPFRAVEPNYVLDQLKNKQYDLESKIENLGIVLKDFEREHSGYEVKPKVIFFQDESGLQNIFEDTFTSSEPIRCFGSFEKLFSYLPEFMPRYNQKRVQKGLKVVVMYPATTKSFLHKLKDHLEERETRLIPPEYDFHLDVMIYDHKVVITSLKEKFGVVIESNEIAEAQKKIFDMVWKNTEAYDKEIMTYYEKELKKKI